VLTVIDTAARLMLCLTVHMNNKWVHISEIKSTLFCSLPEDVLVQKVNLKFICRW